jgi:RES domain-containing protein
VSCTIWTPHAVASKAVLLRLHLWRAVEAQHVASTMRLVDGIDEQRVLEELVEEAKPPRPIGTEDLDYLLFTPFRYPSPIGSRFRAPTDPGVFYGADEQRTACAELGYWRWRFLLDSDGLTRLGPSAQTLFRAGIQSTGIDLREPSFARDQARWMHPSDYGATQVFGRVARDALIGVIRYQSVRDPAGGACGAVLRVDAFQPKRPTVAQTWFLTVTRETVTWQRNGAHFEFSAELPGWTH